MTIIITYEDIDNKYELPVSFLAKELNIPLSEIEIAVKRIVEKY